MYVHTYNATITYEVPCRPDSCARWGTGAGGEAGPGPGPGLVW